LVQKVIGTLFGPGSFLGGVDLSQAKISILGTGFSGETKMSAGLILFAVIE